MQPPPPAPPPAAGDIILKLARGTSATVLVFLDRRGSVPTVTIGVHALRRGKWLMERTDRFRLRPEEHDAVVAALAEGRSRLAAEQAGGEEDT